MKCREYVAIKRAIARYEARHTLDREHLVRRTRAGDMAAASELWRRYRVWLPLVQPVRPAA